MARTIPDHYLRGLGIGNDGSTDSSKLPAKPKPKGNAVDHGKLDPVETFGERRSVEVP
jgi:hypothetical protein